MYPAPPNARSGARGDFWFKYGTAGAAVQTCQTQGLSMIKAAQTSLRERGPTTTVFGPHTAVASQVDSDGIPGPKTIKVLYAWLAALGGAPASVLADIEADFNANNQTNSLGADVSRPGAALSLNTTRALVFAAYYPTGDISRVEIQSTTITPQWGVAPASDGGWAGQKACWDPTRETPPGAPPTTTPTTTPAPAGTSTTPSPSASGGSITTTTSQLTTTERWMLGGGAVLLGLGLLGAIAMAASGGGSRSRRRRRALPSGRRR